MAGPIVRRLAQLADVVAGVIGVSQGGTGASSASSARTNLGLAIGTDVQAYSASLSSLAAATYANGTILSGDGDGVPTTLTVGTNLEISGGALNCTSSGGGGWSSDGSKTTTTLLVRIGSASPPTLYNAHWLAAARDDGASCASGFATFSDTASNGSIRNLFRARGTAASPSPVQTSDTIGIDQWSVRNAAGSTQTVGRRTHAVSATSFTTHPGDVETLELRAPDASSNTTIYTASSSSWAFGVPLQANVAYGTIAAATDASTITFNCASSNVHSVTLGGDRTLALSGDADGQRITLILKQDGTGGRTVTWFGGITWMSDSGSEPTLASGANKRTVVLVMRESSGVYLAWSLGTES